MPHDKSISLSIHRHDYDYFKINKTLSLNHTISDTEGIEDEPVICAFYNPDFIIWSSLGSFYIPCLVMIVLYSRIFKVECNCNNNIPTLYPMYLISPITS